MPEPQPPEGYADYRFFRLLFVGARNLTLACLFLVAWNLLWAPQRAILLFLGNTAALALLVSLVAGTVSYRLFKKRGGHVEKNPPPATLDR